jgi:hypothetical protein
MCGRIWVLTAVVLGGFSSAVMGAGRDDVAVDPEIAGPPWTEQGIWRTKVQQVFDHASRTLSRRLYTIWDPAPARDLDFIWASDNPAADKAGRIDGSGHVIWRIKGKPTYDRSSRFAEYRGTIRNGRLEGRGAYLEHTGLLYDGEWKAGLMHGHGALKLPGGDEYVGWFKSGKANGSGRYIDVTGEIYEGPFVNGQRHGRGTTTLPNGRKYVSQWMNGKEREVSRLVRIAQAPGKGIPGGTDDVRIGITVDRRLPASSRLVDDRLPEGDLWYAVSNMAAGLAIRPDNRRLMSMWKESGEIQVLPGEHNKIVQRFGVLSLVRGQLVPLNLNIEVQNRSPAKVQVSGVYLDVETSETDLQPAIQLSEESAFEEGTYSTYKPIFFVENFGWSAAKEAKVRFAFTDISSPSRSVRFNLSQDLGTIERSVRIDLEPHLRAAGVNLDVLTQERGIICKTKERTVCLGEIKRTGAFGSLTNLLSFDETDLVVGFAGVLEYVWFDSKGSKKLAASPFKIPVHLAFMMSETEQGEGGAPEVITTKALKFKLDASKYRVPVSYRTDVAAGRTSRLVMGIEAAQSSMHEFRVVVQMADGREAKSRPISLLYYLPKWSIDSYNYGSSASVDPDHFENYDFIGADLRQLKDTDEYSCLKACKEEPLCSAYTLDKWNRWCFLKSAVTHMRFDPKNSSNLMGGTPQPTKLVSPKVIERYRNKAFPGYGYLIRQSTSFDECAQGCEGEESCVAFTFKKKTQDCHLLEKALEYTSNFETDSGVKRQLPK